MTEGTVRCGECDEDISVNATKCPHCGSRVMTVGTWMIVGVIGVLASMVVWYTLAPMLPGGYIGAALAAVLFVAVAYGGIVERREAVQEATDD